MNWLKAQKSNARRFKRKIKIKWQKTIPPLPGGMPATVSYVGGGVAFSDFSTTASTTTATQIEMERQDTYTKAMEAAVAPPPAGKLANWNQFEQGKVEDYMDRKVERENRATKPESDHADLIKEAADLMRL